MSQVSHSPGLWPTTISLLGQGIVGGACLVTSRLAPEAGQLTLDILRGDQNPGEYPDRLWTRLLCRCSIGGSSGAGI